MSIFNSLDSRAWIRERLKTFPQGGRGQLTAIARHLKVHNAWLSAILCGDRHFTPEQALELARFFGLPPLESKYLLLLINYERSTTIPLREHYKSELEQLKKNSLKISQRFPTERKLSEQEKSVFYSSWLFSAAHLFASTKKKGVSGTDLSRKFHIPLDRALQILAFLASHGFCEEIDGFFHHRPQSTFVEKGSPHLIRHHINCRMRAIQKSEALAENELMFSSLISLSKQDFQTIRERLAAMIGEVSQTVKKSPAEEVALLSLDFFYIE